MPSTSRTLALVLAGYALPALLTSAHAQGNTSGQPTTNPACTLLTLDEIRQASGQSYDRESPGDELDGGYGRASCQWGARASCRGRPSRC